MEIYKAPIACDPCSLMEWLLPEFDNIMVVGGYARVCAGLSTVPNSDIDIVILDSPDTKAEVEGYLKARDFVKERTKFIKDDTAIHILEFFYDHTPTDVIENQPLSVQSVGMYGDTIIMTDQFIRDEMDKIISINFGMVPGATQWKFATNVNKYIQKGYHFSDRMAMELAVFAAKEAHKDDNLAIGAVVLDEAGEVVGTGSNRINTGSPVEHAELTALITAGRKAHTLISTIEPCPMCLSAARLMGVQRVVYGEKDHLRKFGTQPDIEQKYEDLCKPLPVPDSIREPREGLDRCKEFWDVSGDFPVARNPVPCPTCREVNTIPHRYRFHTVPLSPSYFRCVISYKCCTCSRAWELGEGGEKVYSGGVKDAEWVHGVIIPKEMFEKYVPVYTLGEHVSSKRFHFREMGTWYQEAVINGIQMRVGSKLGDGTATVRWETLIRPHLDRLSGFLIDVGCDAGLHSRMAKKLGFDVLGVDSSHKSIRQAELWEGCEPLGIEYVLSDIMEYDFPESDVVLMSNFHYWLTLEDLYTLESRLRVSTKNVIIVKGSRILPENTETPIDFRVDLVRKVFSQWKVGQEIIPDDARELYSIHFVNGV